MIFLFYDKAPLSFNMPLASPSPHLSPLAFLLRLTGRNIVLTRTARVYVAAGKLLGRGHKANGMTDEKHRHPTAILGIDS